MISFAAYTTLIQLVLHALCLLWGAAILFRLPILFTMIKDTVPNTGTYIIWSLIILSAAVALAILSMPIQIYIMALTVYSIISYCFLRGLGEFIKAY